MPLFADCSIGIRLSDTENLLVEYGMQFVEKTTTTWIASESGKEFEIIFSARNQPSSLQLVVFVDGIELVNRGYDQRKMGREIVCKGVSMDAETVKPFVFSDIALPDGVTAFDHNGLGDVGTIRIEVLRVVFTESQHPKYHIPPLSNDPSSRRSCIRGARGVRLGEQRAFRTKKMTSTPFDPSNPEPIAIFKYVYRPRPMLLSQGIIPTYTPRFVEHLEREPPGLESPYSPSVRSIRSAQVDPPPMGLSHALMSPGSPGSSVGDYTRDDRIRRLKAERERVEQELGELEELRRLREQRARLARELDELEHSGLPPE